MKLISLIHEFGRNAFTIGGIDTFVVQNHPYIRKLFEFMPKSSTICGVGVV